jgi:hypothetical protein
MLCFELEAETLVVDTWDNKSLIGGFLFLVEIK